MGLYNGTVSAQNPTGWNWEKIQVNDSTKAAARNLVIKISPGFQVPDHYLKKMSKQEINDFLSLFWIKNAEDCPRNQGIATNNCVEMALVYTTIELANLSFINGYSDYKLVEDTYKMVADFVKKQPTPFKSLNDQLKDSGKMLTAIIGGLITGGPVGMFVGAAGAVSSMMATERNKKAALIANISANNGASVQQAIAAKKAQEEAAQRAEANKNILTYAMYGGVALALVGGLYVVLND